MKIYGRNRAEQLFNLKLSRLNLLLYFCPPSRFSFDIKLNINLGFEFVKGSRSCDSSLGGIIFAPRKKHCSCTGCTVCPLSNEIIHSDGILHVCVCVLLPRFIAKFVEFGLSANKQGSQDVEQVTNKVVNLQHCVTDTL
jgi:hypothetical protein